MLNLIFCIITCFVFYPIILEKWGKWKLSKFQLGLIAIGFLLPLLDYFISIFLGVEYLIINRGFFHQFDNLIYIALFAVFISFSYSKNFLFSLNFLFILPPFLLYFVLSIITTTQVSFGFTFTDKIQSFSVISEGYLFYSIAALLLLYFRNRNIKKAFTITLFCYGFLVLQLFSHFWTKVYLNYAEPEEKNSNLVAVLPGQIPFLEWKKVYINAQTYKIQKKILFLTPEKDNLKVNISNDLEILKELLRNPFLNKVVKNAFKVPKFNITIKEEGTIIEINELITEGILQIEKLFIFLDRSGNIINKDFKLKVFHIPNASKNISN